MSVGTLRSPCPEWCDPDGDPLHEWKPAAGGFRRQHSKRFGRFSVVQVERGYGAHKAVLGDAEVVPEPAVTDRSAAPDLRAAFALRHRINVGSSEGTGAQLFRR